MKEEFDYQEIMKYMNEVARLIGGRRANDRQWSLPGEERKYKKLAKMYKYYSLNKEKFTQEEQNKIERGIIRKAQGWIPFELYYNCDGTKYAEKLFKTLNRIKTIDYLFI